MPAKEGAATEVPPKTWSCPPTIDQIAVMIGRRAERDIRHIAAHYRWERRDRFARKVSRRTCWLRRRWLRAPHLACYRSSLFPEYRTTQTIGRCHWSLLQYVPVPSLNSVPPTPVTSGIAAGTSTARPGFVESLQSAPPASPEAASQVIPCAFPCCAQDWNINASTRPVSCSQRP